MKVALTADRLRHDIDCAFNASHSASRSVTRFYDLVLAPTGLKATQFMTLMAIHDEGEIAQHDFARKHLIALETLSRVFAGLRRKGLIAARTGDRHEQIYTLTDQGRAVFRQAMPYWERAQTRLRTVLGANGWSSLLSVCNRVAAASERVEQVLRSEHAPQTKPRQ
jgi:DNA-binding MarR family transcriptional regulator